MFLAAVSEKLTAAFPCLTAAFFLRENLNMKYLIIAITPLVFANFAEKMQKELDQLRRLKQQDIVVLTADEQSIETQLEVADQQDVQVKDLFDEVGSLNAKPVEIDTAPIQQSKLIRRR